MGRSLPLLMCAESAGRPAEAALSASGEQVGQLRSSAFVGNVLHVHAGDEFPGIPSRGVRRWRYLGRAVVRLAGFFFT